MTSTRWLVLLLLLAAARGQTIPDPKTLPAPPSVAVTHAPLPASAVISFVVDAIPPTAKYVIYAQVTLDGVTLDRARAAQQGAELSQMLEQLNQLARDRGANLVVLFSNEDGVDLPISQCRAALRLRAVNPVVTAVLFQAGEPKHDDTWRNIRFTTKVPKAKVACVNYAIEMMQDTAGVTKAYWTYGNLPRFVAEAVENHFDTISLTSSEDVEVEKVWLPGCNDPVSISLKKPKLMVTIFKSEGPTSRYEKARGLAREDGPVIPPAPDENKTHPSHG